MASEDIIVRMGMDASGFNRGLQQAKVQSKEFKAGLDKIGGAIAGIGLTALTAKVVDYAGSLADMSSRLGVSTDALQEFGYAAEQSGGSLEDVAAALGKLAVARAAALEGGEAGAAMMETFSKFGVTLGDLRTMRVEDLFRKIGGAVRDAADVQTVLNDATTIFGKNSANVLAAMRNDLDAAADEAKKLGLIIESDVIRRLDELGDKYSQTLKRTVAAFSEPLLMVAEAINTMIDGLKIYTSMANRWVEFFADVSTGMGFGDAARKRVQAIEGDLNSITRLQTARREGVDAAANPAPLNMEEAANGAKEVLRITERIEQLEFDALGVARQRARLADDLQRIEQERANLVANGLLDEKKKAELQLKELEVKKKIAAVDDKQKEAERRMAELRDDRKEAVGALEAVRGEMTKFSLAELASADPRRIQDPALRAQARRARDVMIYQKQAEDWRNSGKVGWERMVQANMSEAEKLKAGMANLQDSERFPFRSMDDGIKRVDKSIAELLRKAKEEGLNMQPLFAK